jgi:hypothetical protein
MRDIGEATEDEMVLAFLRAEIHSNRFGGHARQGLRGDLSLVGPDARTDDPYQNARRRQALAYRGWGYFNIALFNGFPQDAVWRRVALNRDDLGRLKYANAGTWIVLSGESRILRDGAANVGVITPVPENADIHIREVVEEMRQGRTYPELILAAESPDKEHYVVEGHTRATAYFLQLAEGASDEYEAIVAYSPALPRWQFY